MNQITSAPSDPTMFRDLPVDDDHQVRRIRHIRINGIPVRIEWWRTDGVQGETTVFRAADVQGFANAALVEMATHHAGDRQMASVVRTGAFVLVHHSFRM